MFAAVPKAKLTGPCSPLTTIVLPGSYVVTVPVSYVVLVVVSLVVVGLFVVVVSSVVVVLVCANANGAVAAQTKAIIVLFTLCLLVVLGLPHSFVTEGVSGRFMSVLCFDWFHRALFESFLSYIIERGSRIH